MSWTFEKTPLSSKTTESIVKLNFNKPTPVQQATIPLFLSHKDVVVEAVTGSGKTLAFLIPIIELLSKREVPLDAKEVGAIIISPTRELATQISQVLRTLLLDRPGMTSVLLIGGADVSKDLAQIAKEGCNIVVATPGRLWDILDRAGDSLPVKSLEMLVLDEADRLLNMGFERTINNILERLPKQRRTGLFSATMSDALSELIRTGLRNPVKITIKVENIRSHIEQKTPETLQCHYIFCEYDNRLAQILTLLKEKAFAKCILYFGTCASVEYFNRIFPLLPKTLTDSIPSVFGLHGKLEHKKRLKIYQEFTEAQRAVLLCTDLAARGLDFSDVDLVIQYEAPQDPTTFVHRSGRTARSGRSGEAILLLGEDEDAYIEFLANRKIPMIEMPQITPIADDHKHLDIFNILREINAQDRDFLDRSVKAFVAFIRFYQEHQAKFIFRIKDLDIVKVAKSFGLLRLPRMKELVGVNVDGFEEYKKVPFAEIKYKDAQRNKQRQASFEALKLSKKNNEKPLTCNAGGKRKRNDNDDELVMKGGVPVNKVDMEELDEDWKEFQKMKKTLRK